MIFKEVCVAFLELLLIRVRKYFRRHLVEIQAGKVHVHHGRFHNLRLLLIRTMLHQLLQGAVSR